MGKAMRRAVSAVADHTPQEYLAASDGWNPVG